MKLQVNNEKRILMSFGSQKKSQTYANIRGQLDFFAVDRLTYIGSVLEKDS